jgi:hypothetical protein
MERYVSVRLIANDYVNIQIKISLNANALKTEISMNSVTSCDRKKHSVGNAAGELLLYAAEEFHDTTYKPEVKFFLHGVLHGAF